MNASLDHLRAAVCLLALATTAGAVDSEPFPPRAATPPIVSPRSQMTPDERSRDSQIRTDIRSRETMQRNDARSGSTSYGSSSGAGDAAWTASGTNSTYATGSAPVTTPQARGIPADAASTRSTLTPDEIRTDSRLRDDIRGREVRQWNDATYGSASYGNAVSPGAGERTASGTNSADGAPSGGLPTANGAMPTTESSAPRSSR